MLTGGLDKLHDLPQGSGQDGSRRTAYSAPGDLPQVQLIRVLLSPRGVLTPVGITPLSPHRAIKDQTIISPWSTAHSVPLLLPRISEGLSHSAESPLPWVLSQRPAVSGVSFQGPHSAHAQRPLFCVIQCPRGG